MRGGEGAGCARVSIADRCRHSRARFVRLHADGRPGRNAFAAAPRQAYAPAPVAYATAPMPAAFDTSYKLDAGDKLRVVVYGQEGLTNSYAIDAGGSITMPLIGAVPARGRAPAGL